MAMRKAFVTEIFCQFVYDHDGTQRPPMTVLDAPAPWSTLSGSLPERRRISMRPLV
jgi:hypothetical protein